LAEDVCYNAAMRKLLLLAVVLSGCAGSTSTTTHLYQGTWIGSWKSGVDQNGNPLSSGNATVSVSGNGTIIGTLFNVHEGNTFMGDGIVTGAINNAGALTGNVSYQSSPNSPLQSQMAKSGNVATGTWIHFPQPMGEWHLVMHFERQ